MSQGTSDDDAIAELDEMVTVFGTEGEEEQAVLTWTIEDYDPDIAGEYSTSGEPLEGATVRIWRDYEFYKPYSPSLSVSSDTLQRYASYYRQEKD